MISWRWKVWTAVLAVVVMGVVLAWPEEGEASGGSCGAYSCDHIYTDAEGASVSSGSGGDGTNYNWGIRFQESASGKYAYGGRVYWQTGSTAQGNDTEVTLWDSGGSKLAECTLEVIGSVPGWRYCHFSSPVALTAAATYKIAWQRTGAVSQQLATTGSAGTFPNATGTLTSIGRSWAVGDHNTFPNNDDTFGWQGIDVLVNSLATPTPTPTPVAQVFSDSTVLVEEGGFYGGTSRGNVVRVVSSGAITHIRLGRSASQSATIQWAVYPFGSSVPLAQGTAAGLSVGWNTIDIPDIPITAGYYVPTMYVQPFDEHAQITSVTCPSGEGNTSGSTLIYWAGPCARFQSSGSLVYPTNVEGGALIYAVDMRVSVSGSASATATPWATSTPFSAAPTATPAGTVNQYNTPDLVGAVNRLGDILQRVGDQITAAILVHGVLQSLTTLLDKINDLVYQLTQLPLLLASSLGGVLSLPSPDYIDFKNAELDVLIDAKTGGLGGIIEHLDFVEDLLEPDCVGWTGVEFTLPNPRPGQPPMAFAFPPGQLWDNIYCPYIRPWLSLSLNFVFLFVAWRNGLKIFRLKG